LMHKICFTISFISCLYMFRAHVLIIRRSKLHYTASGIITPIGVMIHSLCASSWLNTKINILRCTVSKTSKFICIFVWYNEALERVIVVPASFGPENWSYILVLCNSLVYAVYFSSNIPSFRRCFGPNFISSHPALDQIGHFFFTMSA